MRITSVTKSSLINTPIPPIRMSSLVAPPVGAFGANQGTLGDPGQRPQRRRRPRRSTSRIIGPGDRQQPDQLGRLRDLRVRADRQLHRLASARPAGSTVPASMDADRRRDRHPGQGQARLDHLRPCGQRRRDVRHRGARRHHAAHRARLVDAAVGHERRRPRRRPVSRSRGCATSTRPAGPRHAAHDHRDRPVPLRRRLRRVRRRLPRRRPDAQRLRTTTRHFPDEYVSVVPGQASAPVVVRMPSINLRVLYGNTATTIPAPTTSTTHILVKSTAPAAPRCSTSRRPRPRPSTQPAT